MKAYWGSVGIAPRILGLGANGDEWTASRPGRFTHGERAYISLTFVAFIL
jgi:hypothetical protein